MSLNLDISGESERILREAWGIGLDRAALEALVVEGYRSEKFGISQVRRLLGLTDRWKTEHWLAQRGVHMNYSLEDLQDDREAIDKLFGKSA
jgi:hypothetical protein